MQPRLTGYPMGKQTRPNQDRRIKALAGVSLFEGLSKRNLTRIERIAYLKSAVDGDVLMKQGESGDTMMVVLSGRASVSRGERKLGDCESGQCVGEMALLDTEPRSATVTASEAMQLLVIPGPEFRDLLPKVPRLAEALLATMSRRLREANAASDF